MYAVEHNTTTRKKKCYLANMTSQEDEEESEQEEICRITQMNKILPDNNYHYGIELKIPKQNFNIETALRSPSCRITQNYAKQRTSSQ